LQTAAEVSKSASTILAPAELVTQTVNLIKERYDFYFVGLYLTDAAGEFTVLRAGTGKAGRKLLQSGHKLPVGGKSMIGWVVENTQLWLSQDAKAETDRFANPLLSETRSELALPLVSRGRCIGGLTVQSTVPAAFSEVDVVSLQTMAEQLAVVIDNARLYEDAQQEIVKRRQAEVEIKKLNESLEQRVMERTAELASVNSELEAFVYSVSHDLRAPLRRVLSFADALQQDYGGELDDVAMDYLHRLETAGGQMNDLIESLLNLSRLSQRELVHTPVDLGALAREVADDLLQIDPDRPVEWVIADEMVVHGDPHLLRIVMENLLGNAWKFTANCDHPRIEVGRKTQADREQAYFVRDNGAGFDMNYAKWLFTAFRRLHTVDEFEGTGIGLATVQRIVHRHGGRVWAQGLPGQGATFYFTL
jgi:signal transduction histidine kinase